MTAQIKSLILLAATLIAGFALGLFADATLVRGRRDRIDGMRRPPGLVARLIEVIGPHSAAQADSIRPVLDELARRNQDIIRATNEQLKSRMDSAVAALGPLLDASQRDRLAAEVRRLPPMGPGGGRGGRGGPPGPGRGGPPDDRPPPPPP